MYKVILSISTYRLLIDSDNEHKVREAAGNLSNNPFIKPQLPPFPRIILSLITVACPCRRWRPWIACHISLYLLSFAISVQLYFHLLLFLSLFHPYTSSFCLRLALQPAWDSTCSTYIALLSFFLFS